MTREITAAEATEMTDLARNLVKAHEQRSPTSGNATLGEWRFVGRPKQQRRRATGRTGSSAGGRGFGKTLTRGAVDRRKRALERRCRIALIAPTLGDVRATMVEGETGLLSVIPNAALLGQSRETRGTSRCWS
jgi:phage terminase large subunit-like protein